MPIKRFYLGGLGHPGQAGGRYTDSHSLAPWAGSRYRVFPVVAVMDRTVWICRQRVGQLEQFSESAALSPEV